MDTVDDCELNIGHLSETELTPAVSPAVLYNYVK